MDGIRSLQVGQSDLREGQEELRIGQEIHHTLHRLEHLQQNKMVCFLFCLYVLMLVFLLVFFLLVCLLVCLLDNVCLHIRVCSVTVIVILCNVLHNHRQKVYKNFKQDRERFKTDRKKLSWPNRVVKFSRD